MNHAAFAASLEHYAFKLLDGRKPSGRIDGKLELKGRASRYQRLTEPSGGHLPVLVADGVDDIAGGKIAGSELVWIKPDAHAVVAWSEKCHIADAFDPRQFVLDA